MNYGKTKYIFEAQVKMQFFLEASPGNVSLLEHPPLASHSDAVTLIEKNYSLPFYSKAFHLHLSHLPTYIASSSRMSICTSFLQLGTHALSLV